MMWRILVCILSLCLHISSSEDYVSYKVYTNAQVGWQGAIKSCSNEGATLAMISDSYTQRKIVEKLVEMGGITGKYWFDGKVSMDSDIWKSKSGSPLTHFNWADRQPITGPNKCAVLSNNGEYMWEAENCGERNGYICTFHANNKITVPCDDNWIQYGNACYSLRMDGRNWTSARDECAEAGAELVKINTNTATRLLSVVEKKIGLIMDRFWIGLHEVNGEYVWMDGSPIKWSYWLPGEPTIRDDEECVAWVINDKNNGWNNENCDYVSPFICERGYTLEQAGGIDGRWHMYISEHDRNT